MKALGKNHSPVGWKAIGKLHPLYSSLTIIGDHWYHLILKSLSVNVALFSLRMMDPIVLYYGKGQLTGFLADPDGVLDVVSDFSLRLIPYK